MTHSEAPVALVTGASRGIGAAIARALLKAGWRVGAVSRSRDGTAGLAKDGGPTVLGLAADVTDAGQVDAAVHAVNDQFGQIDVLVNNAGLIEPERPLWEADPEQWWQVVEVNVRGPFLVTRAVAPLMIAAGGGRIINLNSGAATRANAELSGYTASKAALARLTGSIHLAGASKGLLAFDLAPGVVATEMTASMRSHEGRTEWTDPSEVTALVLALAAGELDAFSGRMVRAGTDQIDQLRAVAAAGLGGEARTIGLRAWGSGDPLA